MAITSRNASSITLGGTLAVRAVITCTSSYAITEDDINALEVSSAASVTASDVRGNAVDADDVTVVSLDQVRAWVAWYEHDRVHDGDVITVPSVTPCDARFTTF